MTPLRAAALLTVLLLGLASGAYGQVAFHAQTSVIDFISTAAPTTTLAHTTAAADNRILLVSVAMNLRNALGATVTSVTYGGFPLSMVAAVTDASTTTRTEVWFLLSPPAGAANVVVTTGGLVAGETVEAVVGATTFSDVDQTTPPSAAGSGTGSQAAVSVPSTAAADVVVDFVSARETVTLTAAGAQTAGFNVSTGGTNDDLQAASSRRPAAAGTTAMSWSLSANRAWAIVAVHLRRARADVELTQTAGPDPVVAGGIITYRFVARNRGPSTATGVVFTDTLPASTPFLSRGTTLGTCSGTTTVSCLVPRLAPEESVEVTITARAPLASGPTAVNTGTMTTTTIDPGVPNSASASTTVLATPLACAPQPGKDGAAGVLAGVVNSYWAGDASAAAGATSITLGVRRGAAQSITPGDLVLIVQMQDAAIDSNNDGRYGSGAGAAGDTVAPGAGVTNPNNAGRYEYAVAGSTVGAAGGTLTLGGGLLFAYTNAGATATSGQRRFQVVRVPQYASATLGPTLTASAWNGRTGGILAIDVDGALALGGATVSVDGRGFRGGGPRQLAGGGAASAIDYRNTGAQNAHGIKGEGIAGTPEHVLDGGAAVDTGPQGYPNGDYARGAPGNAGGGGTDGDPALNGENSGGGGGANGGDGGRGGRTWQSNLAVGGFGGAAFAGSAGRVVLGGGGGAGARNNSSAIASSGGAGGGIVLIRAGELTGTGTVTANGASAFNDTQNDGGGGGGAGGSIVVLSRRGGLAGATLAARGGRGGDAWRTQAPGGFPGERHGPGGGGGGGFIAVNGVPLSASVAGGASGITTTANDPFGAEAGAPGTTLASASFDEVAGVTAACASALQRIGVTKSFDPASVFRDAPSRLTVTLTNPNASDAISGIELVDFYPVGLENVASPEAATTCAGATVTAVPGGTSLRLTGGTLAAGGQCTVSVKVASPTVGTYTNVVAAGAVTTANAGASVAPASAALEVTVFFGKGDPTRPEVAKTFTPPVVALGGVATLSIRVINGTEQTFTGMTFVDVYPPGLTNAAAANVTNSCGGTVFAAPGGSSVSLSEGTLPTGSSCTVTVEVAAAAGAYPNVIVSGAVQVAETPPNLSAAEATLIVSALAPPSVVKSFAPNGVTPGQPARLTIRIVNPNPTALTGVTFVDEFPSGLRVADPEEATSTCGAFFAFPGQRAVGVEDGTVPASGACEVSVLVVAADSATGLLTNTIPAGAIVSANAPANPASASASLAILPTGAPAIPIPLLSPLGLACLATLLAVIAFRRRRAGS